MMLVSNVALGHCKDFTKFQKDLQGPPEGYDSCHGVASVDENYSEFKVFLINLIKIYCLLNVLFYYYSPATRGRY